MNAHAHTHTYTSGRNIGPNELRARLKLSPNVARRLHVSACNTNQMTAESRELCIVQALGGRARRCCCHCIHFMQN